MKAPIDTCTIVAVQLTADGRGPFEDGDLIVRADNGGYLRAREYLADALVGEPYSAADYRALCADGQAVPLQAQAPLPRGAVGWVLRQSFDQRAAARADLAHSGALRVPLEFHARSEDWMDMVAVVDHLEALHLRQQWADRALEHALDHVRISNWSACIAVAEQAHALRLEIDARVMGLLVLAYWQVGRQERALGYLKVAERSKGPSFRADVERHRDELSNLTLPVVQSSTGSPWIQNRRMHLERGQQALVTRAVAERAA